jgi:hypothetical protein
LPASSCALLKKSTRSADAIPVVDELQGGLQQNSSCKRRTPAHCRQHAARHTGTHNSPRITLTMLRTPSTTAAHMCQTRHAASTFLDATPGHLTSLAATPAH